MSVTLTQKYVKSPLNYVGGKYRLLPQILPHFPKDIGTFVDLFAGGCNVGVNVDAERIVFNDKQREVIELVYYIYLRETDATLREIDAIIAEYGLSKENAEGYLRLRADYNAGYKTPLVFYVLIAHSFNNQIRFNMSGEFNMPFGKNRSSFNPTLRKRFIEFADHIKTKDLTFTVEDFKDLDLSLTSHDFVYCDPPYLNTTATYNEQGGWNEDEERSLLRLLDGLNERNVRFALSNVFESKGIRNEILIDWAEKYNVKYLDYSYSNASYQIKDRTAPTVEVLVTNY